MSSLETACRLRGFRLGDVEVEAEVEEGDFIKDVARDAGG